MTNLNQIWGKFPAYFVLCDVDGDGKFYRLAISRDQDEDGDGIYFPTEDFDDIVSHYMNYEAVGLIAPDHPDSPDEP